MRTTLDLPDGLVEEARELLGSKSKTEAVVQSLKEIIQRRRIEQLKSLLGKVEIRYNPATSRRRP